MYIAELDRPWTETPFKFQGFVLKSHQELELLGRHCSYVFVDPDRREVASPLTDTVPPQARAKVDLSAAGKFGWNEISTVEQEYPRAAASYGAAEVLVREALLALRSGKALHAELIDLARGITASEAGRSSDSGPIQLRASQTRAARSSGRVSPCPASSSSRPK